MVFYSTKSREKVFHLPHCRILRRMCKEYKKQFYCPEEARVSGYRMCSCCSPVGVKLRKEREAVRQFCEKNAIQWMLDDGRIHIRTHLSEWQIIANGKNNKLFLYHKNVYRRKEKIPSIVSGYHSQAFHSKTILGYLDYIVQHDEYVDREKQKAREYAVQKRKVRHERQSPCSIFIRT